MSPDILEIGVVLKPHGIRGELKVKLHNAESDALTHVERVRLRAPNGKLTEHEVVNVRFTSKQLLLTLGDVDDRDGAEALRDYVVEVQRSDLPALEEGEYYLADLVGCSVVFGERVVGVVQSVRLDPTTDTLVIEAPDGARLEQPLGDAWVRTIDVKARKIELENEDGLIV